MRSPRIAFSGHAALVALLVIAALVTLPAHAALAVSPAQIAPDDATPLQLGEFVFREMANGETAAYQISIPEAATYRITAVDEEKAVAFDLIVTDAAGNEVFNDIFETVELALDSGEVTLQFIAVDAEALEFAVFAYFGTMTADLDQPGTLLPGSIYYEDRVNEERYALLTVPETPYPQQVFLYIEPGEEDVFDLSIEGDEFGYLDLTAEEGDLLYFWSQGGEYLITAAPTERRSEFSLIPYLGGAPAFMTVDEPFDAAIAAGQSEVILGLTLEVPYEDLTFEADAEVDEISITVLDRLYDGIYYESSYWEPSLAVEGIQAGVYYIIVEVEPADEDIPVTLVASGTAGEPPTGLTSGETVTGAFEEGDTLAAYEFNVTQAGALVTVALSSDDEDTDFDLEAGMTPDSALWYTFFVGSRETLSFIAPAAGRYYIGVLSNDYTGKYALTVTETGPAPAVVVDGLTWGSVDAGGRSIYQLEVAEPGDFLTVALVGQEGLDLDLYISGYTPEGYGLPSASSSASGASEIAGMLLTEAGLYEIAVSAEYSEEDGSFVLLTRLEDPNLIAGQWAMDATATSQYEDNGYSALQATGAPDTPGAGDFDTAWAPEGTEVGEQTLELTYEHAVVPGAVRIYENYNPGAVIRIEAYDTAGDAWVTLWEGEAEPPQEEFRIFSPELAEVDFAANVIRIILDTDAIENWNEIDAVELAGRP